MKVVVIVKDLTAPNAPEEIYQEVKVAGLEVDYLINNAGFGGYGKFYEREWKSDLAMIQLNIIVLTELSRLFLPEMVQRNHGRILNVSSTASLPPGGPLQSVYFATKHYVTALSYGIAGELEGSQVTVTALLPGATETEFAAQAGMEEAKLFANAASAHSVARDGYEGMLAGKLDVVSGLTSSQKVMMASLPFLSKKFALQQIHQMQSEE